MKIRNLLVLPAVVLLAACSNGSHSKYDGSNADYAASADTVTQTPDSIRLVKTAEMNLKVSDVSKASDDIAVLTKRYHGIVMRHHMQSDVEQSHDVQLSNDSVMRVSSFNATANLTVKVPPDSLEQFMTRVAKLGLYVNVRKMDIEDKTLDYIAAKLKSQNRAEVDSERKTGKIKFKNPDAIIKLKDDITNERISNMQVDAGVKSSVVDLALYQNNTIITEVMANDDLSVYQIPFVSRVGLAIAHGWSVFADLFVGLLNLWVFILAGWLGWLAYCFYKKKRIIAQGNI